jgi:hypothetical protein
MYVRCENVGGLYSKRGPRSFYPVIPLAPRDTLLHQKPVAKIGKLRWWNFQIKVEQPIQQNTVCTGRCCCITVDSATTALQNGACTYRCISKKCTINHPFTQWPHEKSGILWKLHLSVLFGKKQYFWQYYINSEPCMAYYPKWLKWLFILYKQHLRNSTILLHSV